MPFPSSLLGPSATHSKESFLSDPPSSSVPTSVPPTHPGHPFTSLLCFNCWLCYSSLNRALRPLGAVTSWSAFYSQGLAKWTHSSGHLVDVCPMKRTSWTLFFCRARAKREGTCPRPYSSWGPELRLGLKTPKPLPAGHLGHGWFWTFSG